MLSKNKDEIMDDSCTATMIIGIVTLGLLILITGFSLYFFWTLPVEQGGIFMVCCAISSGFLFQSVSKTKGLVE